MCLKFLPNYSPLIARVLVHNTVPACFANLHAGARHVHLEHPFTAMGAHAMIHSNAALRLKLGASLQVLCARNACAHLGRNAAEAHEHLGALAVEEQLGRKIYGRGMAARTASSTQKASNSARSGGMGASASPMCALIGVGGSGSTRCCLVRKLCSAPLSSSCRDAFAKCGLATVLGVVR